MSETDDQDPSRCAADLLQRYQQLPVEQRAAYSIANAEFDAVVAALAAGREAMLAKDFKRAEPLLLIAAGHHLDTSAGQLSVPYGWKGDTVLANHWLSVALSQVSSLSELLELPEVQ